jgi:NADPH-dependent curcumin reductase CurA
MKQRENRQVRLKSRPTGIPQADNFEIVTTSLPDIGDRQFVVRNEYLSVEPAMRGWVSAVANYSTPVGIGEVMRAFSAGTVVASRHPNTEKATPSWACWDGRTTRFPTAARSHAR